MSGYYNRPIVKPPTWRDFIPTYFFTGGLAGAAATLAFVERSSHNDDLADAMLFGSAGAVAVSALCLIADLKRPERFLNMLRVFKPTSPMSVGVYLLTAFGAATMAAAASRASGIGRPLGRGFESIAGLLGPLLSVYTAVLIGDTAIPAWHYGRKTMPLLFAATSASSAGAWGLMTTPLSNSTAARNLAILGGLGMLAILSNLHAELGPVQVRAYKEGQAGALSRMSRWLTAAGTTCAVLGRRSEPVTKLGAALSLAGGLAERFAICRAGCASASDPSYVVEGQRTAAMTTASLA